MCYNKSMKRIDVLKGIEQILVQKAYETGHISHRADGDWQKQADGSWIPYKGQSDQSTPQAQENSTTNTEHGEIIKQDFESVPKSIKDKMFTIAQQYQSEWAEDSDEDIRSMAEDDVEAISQMLWDNADEETRNSWLNSDNSNKEDRYGEITEEDLVETPNDHYYSTEDITTTTIDGEDFSSEEYNDFKSEIESLASGEFFNDVANIRVDPNNSDMPDNDDLMEVTDKLIDQFDLSKNLTDEQYEDLTEVIQDIWSQNNPTSDDDEDYPNSDGVQKSAVRDMRSTPITKNMGF